MAIARISEISTPQKMSCIVKPSARDVISLTSLPVRLSPQLPAMNRRNQFHHWTTIGRSRPSSLVFSAMTRPASRDVLNFASGSNVTRTPQ